MNSMVTIENFVDLVDFVESTSPIEGNIDIARLLVQTDESSLPIRFFTFDSVDSAELYLCGLTELLYRDINGFDRSFNFDSFKELIDAYCHEIRIFIGGEYSGTKLAISRKNLECLRADLVEIAERQAIEDGPIDLVSANDGSKRIVRGWESLVGLKVAGRNYPLHLQSTLDGHLIDDEVAIHLMRGDVWLDPDDRLHLDGHEDRSELPIAKKRARLLTTLHNAKISAH